MDLPEASKAAPARAPIRQSSALADPVSELLERRRTWPAWCFVGLSSVCIGLLVWASLLGSRGCRADPIPLAFGRDSDVSVALPADTPCAILLKPLGAPLDDIAIEGAPAHGTLTSHGRAGVVYRPQPGFRGGDSFDFSLHRRSNSTLESFTVHIRALIN
jgi:hypothetical protein